MMAECGDQPVLHDGSTSPQFTSENELPFDINILIHMPFFEISS